MAGTTTAPANGVIRNDQGSARRVSKGAPIPEGWTFDEGKANPGPAENTKGKGPSQTAGSSSPTTTPAPTPTSTTSTTTPAPTTLAPSTTPPPA